jgi:hypothetical protein
MNDEARIDEIVSMALGNRGRRDYSRTGVRNATGVPLSQKKASIIAMCCLWLEEQSVDYGLGSEEEDRVARMADANDRYDKTNTLVTLFCRTHFANEGHTFRWSHLSGHRRERIVYAVESIVLETLTSENSLPLERAVSSWATSHLLSIAIRNEGERKRSLLNRVVSCFF